jgi:hypothetical protein
MPSNGRSRRFEGQRREQTIQQEEEPKKSYFNYKESDDESDVIVKREPEEKTDHLCDARMKHMFNIQN